MKALSLKQPFVELILQGKKKIELRRWNTHFRGEFLLHASQKPDKQAMTRFGFTQLPLGCIVGKARLVDVKKYTSKKEHENDRHLHLSSKSFVEYGFVLKDVERFEKPIFCKGKLNLWETIVQRKRRDV